MVGFIVELTLCIYDHWSLTSYAFMCNFHHVQSIRIEEEVSLHIGKMSVVCHSQFIRTTPIPQIHQQILSNAVRRINDVVFQIITRISLYAIIV